jgi:CheY-like chemotaxis protein
MRATTVRVESATVSSAAARGTMHQANRTTPALAIATLDAGENLRSRVLVVDDVATNRMLLQKLLRKFGFANVTSVADGQEAVDAVVAGDFDIILMDTAMPIKDGNTATREIRALADSSKATVPILAVTASCMAADVAECLASGANGVVAKPYAPAELLRAINDCVH